MPNTYPDVVIVVPGLIGSVLAKDGVPIWGTSPGALWRVVAGSALESLRISAVDDGRDDLGDGIEATALVPNLEIAPGLWKQGGYSRLADNLVVGMRLEKGANYFEFAYDWRRDNRVSARRLARFSLPRLERWRARSGNAAARLVLVCHSMGGLVARYFVECLEGWKATRSIVSFGAPFRGSGNALGYLCNGFAWKVGPLTAFDGTLALRSFDSVYQLLPIYPFVDVGGVRLSRVADLDLPNLNRRRALAAAAFHEEIRSAQEANAASEEYRREGARVRPVVGTQQPTFQSATFDPAKGLTLLESHSGRDLKGDGTVPRVSAIPLEAEDDMAATYVPNTHSALQSDGASLDHLRGVLTGAGIDLRSFRDADTHATIGLSIDDAYGASEPVRLSATTTEYVQTLSASIVGRDGGPPVEALMRREGDGYVARVRLPSGAYRVTVDGDGLRSVSDVFLVVDV